MKQRIKIGCFIATASVIGGLVVYGGAWAMYRVADALSLSPALKNLAPLGAVFLVWVVGSRSIKYFQRRTEHRKDTSSWTKSDEELREAWLEIKAKGKNRYVWRRGVVGWGLPVFAIFTPVMLVFGPSTHHLSRTEIIALTIMSLFIWTGGGYFFGLSTWKTLNNKYR